MKKNILIGVLVVLVICLGGFIVYDKVLKDDTDKVGTNDKIEESINTTEEEFNFDITYKEEDYISKNSKGYQISKSIRNLPVISSKKYQDSADKIVSSLTNISDNVWNRDVKSMADQVTEMETDKDMELGVKYLFNTSIVNENYVSFSLTMSGAFGGVGWSMINGYNYNISDGSEILFTDLSDTSSSLEEVCYNYLVDYIKRQDYVNYLNNDNIIGNWQEQVKDKMFKSGYWYFTDKNIKFVFSKYEIGNATTGNIVVDVPKDTINSYLKEEYKVK